MTFDEARALFPVLERFAYLNAGTFGPLARQTTAVMLEQLQYDVERGRSGKPYIDEMIDERARVRGAIAELLSADPERISLTASRSVRSIRLAGEPWRYSTSPTRAWIVGITNGCPSTTKPM